MATKWRNRLTLLACILLFTFGLNGLLTNLDNAGRFLNKDYFHTGDFHYELNQFINELSTYELHYVSKAEAKRNITVTKEEIEEHRYYYGSLSEQLANIKAQYEHKITEAQEAGSPDIAQMYKDERDAKLEDITNNFKSDDHVRQKIVREKEGILDEYYRQLEQERQEFLKKKDIYTYYLQDTTTGEVYTNMAAGEQEPSLLFAKQEDWYYVQHFSAEKGGYLSTADHFIYPHYYDVERKVSPYRSFPHFEEVTTATTVDVHDIEEILANKRGATFSGYIAVPKTVSVSSSLMRAYHNYQQQQLIFFGHTLSALAALLFSILIFKRAPVQQALPVREWEPYYHRLPLDLRMFTFILTAFFTWLGLTSWLPVYHSQNILIKLVDILSHIGVTALLLLVTILQGIYLRASLLDRAKLVEEWQHSLALRCYQALRQTLTGVFLNRKLGTQLMLLLAIVFCFGAGLMIVPLEPEFILVYLPAFMLIGLPTLFILLRRTGYFNRIVEHTNQLVQGRLEPDLEVKGKSPLATLASNINTLKHGVKQSQQEQVKSERLKTELITNVSHDLRTPLTSIITYTELLKNTDLAAEDREAYLQIIDRKSKRLKVLIDDLFEVSKMASGNMELNRAKVDLVQLLKQALAEHDEAISQSKLIFRVNHPDQPVNALVDGQKIWRAFDNLIGNILKYSLENTRVYLSVETTMDKVILTFRNITKYELGENIEEMFERFKRGDTSRQTDGSGLGLAIAKSIVDLHNGNLELEVDGDLFKVTVSLAKHPH